MRLFISILFLSVSFNTFSQDSTLFRVPDSSSVIIHKDPRLELLINKQSEINEKIYRDSRRTAKGFRILVINTSKRNDAIEAKSKMYSYFPELKVYLIYKSPYFRLKAGNFKEREDAEIYQKKINKYFPNGVFVVNDIIEVSPDEDSNHPDPR
ncbi:MAG: SPOR domain-containing protein [Bacteroidetes bacterium]|nr:SPOR domain-containing protein [Bacteroidota bacterium]MBS1931134.1 SPOR domain-containing protein [Bacteroidota bacterium]